MTRFGVTIDISPRELPFPWIGGGGGSLGILAGAPVYAVAFGTILITFRVSVRVRRRRRI